jgi:hypothetical protein
MHPKPRKPFAQVYIDPGVRTGITGYCPEGVAFKMGDELFELVRNKLIKADKCMSAADLLKNSGGKNQRSAHPTSSTSTENQGASRASRRASQDMPVSL